MHVCLVSKSATSETMHSDAVSQYSIERSMQWPHGAAVMFIVEVAASSWLHANFHQCQLSKKRCRDLIVKTKACQACILCGAWDSLLPAFLLIEVWMKHTECFHAAHQSQCCGAAQCAEQSVAPYSQQKARSRQMKPTTAHQAFCHKQASRIEGWGAPSKRQTAGLAVRGAN